jgi:Flp pilus assembly protein TadD
MTSLPRKSAAWLAVSLIALALPGAAEGTTASRLLAPVFPASRPGLAYAEGEDALSTNMASEPTLNYSCSGNRALQLSRPGQLPGGGPYYAEYGVYADAPGRYELWYSGTPPGARDEFAASLASPVSVSVDGGAPRALYREDVNVVSRISPSFYWVRTFALDLARGAHVIRFEVSAKRRLDDRFFFYLDAFFLATGEALAAAAADRAGLPAAFPSDHGSRAIDRPFRSFEELQAQIQAAPTEVGTYIELADEYALAGDNLNALKTLSRAAVIAPRDPEVRLLSAKNRIWRGDVKEGIEAYGIYVSLRPDDLQAYEEAGKVAAWSGRFSDAEYFYATGLAAFPGDPSLTVNRGLAYLWAGRVADAERDFAAAEKSALADPASSADLAAVYSSNGFPDRAVDFYEKAIAAFPAQLGLYLEEGALLAAQGKDAAAGAVEARAEAAFEPSEELDAVLADARARRQLKADRIAELEARIAADPDDFGLRDELTRVYAWNGRKREAARQLESILAARFYRALAESDAGAPDLLAAHFTAAALLGDADARLAALGSLSAKARAAKAAADKSLVDLKAREKAAAAAAAAGKAEIPTDAARGALLGSVSSLAEAISALDAEDARMSLLIEGAAGAKRLFDAAASREESEDESFKALASGLGWSFDSAWALAELSLPADRGDQTASLARARVLAKAEDLKNAGSALSAVTSESLAEGRLMAELMIAARRDYRGIFKAASEPGSLLPALAAAAAELETVAAALPSSPSGPLEAPPADADGAALEAYAAAAFDALALAASEDSRIRGEVSSARAALGSVLQGASALEDRRLARAWYAFESGALDLRSELGSYYDGLGQAASATRQYRRVLALDRNNIRAMHSLALAEDKAGDWSAAASLFQAVYSADPYYGNAASLYNGIARRHAPGLEVSTTVLADLNLFDYRSDASAIFPLGSFLALKPTVSIRSIRDRNLGFPAYIGAAAGLEVPLSLATGLGEDYLALRPSLSLIATSADFSAIGATTVSPAEFLGALSLYSAGGAALDWGFGAWKGSASYSYAPLPDSLNPAFKEAYPGIFQLFSHRLEISGGAYLPGSGIFRYFAPRLYATGSYVPEDGANLYGTALAELIPGFRISDSPWINLGVPLDLVYEDSKDAHTSPYFAADQALTAKGGLLWQASYGLKDGQSLSLSLQGMAGLYMSRAFSDLPTKDLYLYGYARFEWMRGGATYYLSLESSATDPFVAEPKYWSFSIVGGVAAKQPNLIAP